MPNLEQNYELVIANRMLSSWSLRAWLIMRWSRLDFSTTQFFMDHDDFSMLTRQYSPIGKVPILKITPKEGKAHIIPDSLAIAETMAEHAPHLWPKDSKIRAQARVIANYIHAGVPALRNQCPMNLSKQHNDFICSQAIKDELAELSLLLAPIGDYILATTQPALAPPLGILEAFLTPIASRVHSYRLPVASNIAEIFDALLRTQALREWLLAAYEEEHDPAHIRNQRYANDPLSQCGNFPLLHEFNLL